MNILPVLLATGRVRYSPQVGYHNSILPNGKCKKQNLYQKVGYLMSNPIYIYIYIHIYISCCTANTDHLDPLSPLVSIVHRPREIFKATSCIGTELLYIDSSWSSCLYSSMWRGPQEYVAYEFVLTSPAVSRMSGSSNLDSFRDGW